MHLISDSWGEDPNDRPRFREILDRLEERFNQDVDQWEREKDPQ
jgi:hypothetical protein